MLISNTSFKHHVLSPSRFMLHEDASVYRNIARHLSIIMRYIAHTEIFGQFAKIFCFFIHIWLTKNMKSNKTETIQRSKQSFVALFGQSTIFIHFSLNFSYHFGQHFSKYTRVSVSSPRCISRLLRSNGSG